MRRLQLFISSATVLYILPLVSLAQVRGTGLADGSATGGAFGTLLKTIIEFSNSVLIPFIIGIGFLVFVWGMFQYFIAGGANDDSKEKGKSLMIYATVGFLLIIVFWGIVNLLANATGLDNSTLENIPKLPETGQTR